MTGAEALGFNQCRVTDQPAVGSSRIALCPLPYQLLLLYNPGKPPPVANGDNGSVVTTEPLIKLYHLRYGVYGGALNLR